MKKLSLKQFKEDLEYLRSLLNVLQNDVYQNLKADDELINAITSQTKSTLDIYKNSSVIDWEE